MNPEPRMRDYIDVSLDPDGPHRIGIATAWSNLRACVLEHTGTDIDRGAPFEFFAKPVSHNGNRRTYVLIALPKIPVDILHRLETGFAAIYGEIPLAMAEAAAAMPDNQLAAWARPLGRFTAEMIS